MPSQQSAQEELESYLGAYDVSQQFVREVIEQHRAGTLSIDDAVQRLINEASRASKVFFEQVARPCMLMLGLAGLSACAGLLIADWCGAEVGKLIRSEADRETFRFAALFAATVIAAALLTPQLWLARIYEMLAIPRWFKFTLPDRDDVLPPWRRIRNLLFRAVRESDSSATQSASAAS